MAMEWFKLTHDPMWIEWRLTDCDRTELGALLYTHASGAVGCYTVSKVGGLLHIHHLTFKPERRIREDGKGYLACEYISRTSEDEQKTSTFQVDLVVDFVIRFNSPTITDIAEGPDLSAINRKRAKSGKQPLFSHSVVDLNARVKAGLKAAGESSAVEEGKRRLHWKRGHFKCRKSGVFWWNPHLAGRAELGVVTKEYAA